MTVAPHHRSRRARGASPLQTAHRAIRELKRLIAALLEPKDPAHLEAYTSMLRDGEAFVRDERAARARH